MRRHLIASSAAIAALLSAALASAQLYGWRRCSMDDHVGKLTEVVLQRFRGELQLLDSRGGEEPSVTRPTTSPGG